ncbi:MAG: UMP kinase [Clostridia bacterium]|jgi:uridylate kinase|nr:UMP kinase [Clostridia bacterium]
MYRRVLLKISGEALSSTERPVCFEKIEKTALDVKKLHDAGIQVGIVTGGGNIMRGRDAAEQDRSRMDNMGMLATAINALALQDCLIRIGVPTVVMSAVAMNRFCEEFTARGAVQALEDGKVVLFAAGSGCPYFSTDTAASLRALEIQADALLLAKNIDAVYSADPKKDPNAKRYSHLTYQKVLDDRLQATDLTAITLCREQGLPILVFALKEIERVAAGETVGTRIDNVEA